MDFAVREAEADDVEGILDLLEEVAGEGRWLGAELPFDREERNESFLAAMQDDRKVIFVAKSEPEVIGNLGLEVASYGVAQFGMCVAQSWRGRGVGTALIQEAIAAARRLGAHKISCQVWPHNQAARRLYRRHGFVEEGRLRRHYPRRSGEIWDAVVMGLVLDEERPGSPFPDDE